MNPAEPRLPVIDRDRAEALHDLTARLETDPSFTYLRLGDGELAYLLALQDDPHACVAHHPDRRSVEIAHCCPGLEATDVTRLRQAYEQCTYLDRHDHLEFNARNLPRLKLSRPANAATNATPTNAGILHDWSLRELPDYLSRHRVIFCGAEAALLAELMKNPDYRERGAHWWQRAQSPVFLQPHGNGLDLSRHQDAIFDQLCREVQASGADTIFLSLGGAAKFLGVRLAQTTRVRVVDFGSMMRGLCYAGSSGHADWRASYLPFFFHVPYDVFMPALEAAHPGESVAWLINKAHCQLSLELLRKRTGEATAADPIDPTSYDPSPENLRRFATAMNSYRRTLRPRARRDPAAASLVREFDAWRYRKGLTPGGRLMQTLRPLLRRLRGLA